MTRLPPPPDPRPSIPACAWRRPIGLGWDRPYTVRRASNLDNGPWHGMPLGGFGSGCIGRSPRGDFNLWQISGGEQVFRPIPGCQFAVFEQPEGQPGRARALCTEPPGDGTLSRWDWYPAATDEEPTGTYAALYPRSWFEYENVFASTLTCEQFSPVLPGNYQETSYPVAIFEWTAHNPTDAPIVVSVLLSWENATGWFANALGDPEITVRDDGSPEYEYRPRWGESEGNANRWIEDFFRVGCVMSRAPSAEADRAYDLPPEGEGQWAIVTVQNAAVEVFYHARWNPAGDGGDLWEEFSSSGALPNENDDRPAAPGERIGAAIAVRAVLRPGRTRKIPFILCWDFPAMEFAPGTVYPRRYTDFFGRNGQNAWTIARTALKHYGDWRENIEAWQRPLCDRPDLSDRFKMALFNELYDLTAGGAIWSAASNRDPKGQFAVLECFDYCWYESLDVRLYGSFALLMLWPELEKSVVLAFARAIPLGDDTPRTIGYNQAPAIRKAEGAAPHDLGAPNEHPWEKTNYTSYQDCNLWKDLGCDFVLQVYRDYRLTGESDLEFLAECWGAIARTLDYVKDFDRDGDGIPENSGAPDQTFDDWQLRGISAYCGGLWLAALEAAIAVGQVLLAAERRGDRANAGTLLDPQAAILDPAAIAARLDDYKTWLDAARPRYQEALWNGSYYRLDSESGSEVVMADQLCGQFYARLLGLPDIVPEDCARSAARAVYESCFVKFGQYCQTAVHLQPVPGADSAPTPVEQRRPLGLANGVRPDGSPEDPNATHPLEVWTGINFGIAAFWLQLGLKDEAFEIAEAAIYQVYTHGLQFRTPEALTAHGTFRACTYLRAMAIWAIYGVLTDFEDLRR